MKITFVKRKKEECRVCGKKTKDGLRIDMKVSPWLKAGHYCIKCWKKIGKVDPMLK